MDHKIKTLVEAVAHAHTKDLIEKHVTGLHFENNHLVIFVDNASPFHELNEKEIDLHLKKALEQVYGVDITYELKTEKPHHGMHDRDKTVEHNIRQ